MIKATRPFEKSVSSIRVGAEVPQNNVNLSHYYTPPLVSSENIVIGDNTIFTLAPEPEEVLMYADADFILKDEILNSNTVDGELVEITDKFLGDTPLYYCYKLNHKFYGETSLLQGVYKGESIILEDAFSGELPSSYKYVIYLKRANMKGTDINIKKYILSQVYDVYIYTSFQIRNNFKIMCYYNALIDDRKGYAISPNYSEAINPQPFFKKVDNVLDTIENNECYYMQKSHQAIRSSIIHIGSAIDDPRDPQLIRVMLEVTFIDGEVSSIFIPENEDERIKIYNQDSLLDSESKLFEGDKQILTKLDIVSYFDKKEIVKVTPHVVQVDTGLKNIEFFVRPDGYGKLYAKTSLQQITVAGHDVKKLIEKDGKILTRYSVRMKDRKPIKLLHPRETNNISSWYVRVQNGKYSIVSDSTIYHYFIPEYYNQVFDKELGYPYKKVVGEKPEIISSTSIKLKCAPLYARGFDDIKVVKKREDGRVITLDIESWNNNDGVINLKEYVNENDDLEVDYIFEEDSYVYTGYTVSADSTDRSVCLDCNPNKHHYVSLLEEDNSITDIPTFMLLDKIVHVYIRPAVIIGTTERTYNEKVVLHSFEKISDELIEKEKLQLIGMLYIRPNSSYYSLELDDSRTRGGGITEALNDEIRRLLEPESDYYWDIGFWDGEPFNECSVVIVRLDKNVLIKNGGKFTEEEVEVAVNKHLAYGTLAIIEYITTYNLEDITINNLEITDYISIE